MLELIPFTCISSTGNKNLFTENFLLMLNELSVLDKKKIFSFLFSFREFLAPGAHNPVNVEGRISELVRGRIENHVDRYCFEEAQVKYTLY